MVNKYNIDFDKEVIIADKTRLINQIWKLIPMREKEENWDRQLSMIIEEVAGLAFIFYSNLDFLVLLSKLEGLRSEECKDFMLYRTTTFRCIKLLVKVMDDVIN